VGDQTFAGIFNGFAMAEQEQNVISGGPGGIG
jgi:hypothetical protein